MRTLKDILEGLLRGEEATLIDGDDIVRSPEIALGVKCTDIQQVAEVVGKCIGQKIKVKKMTGKWYVDGFNSGAYIDAKGLEGFAIEYKSESHMGSRVDRKMWFAVWERRLICRQDVYYYSRKPGGKSGNIAMWTPAEIANIENYRKIKNGLGVIGSGTRRHDNMYHWGEDTLWDWLTKSGFERFFDKI